MVETIWGASSTLPPLEAEQVCLIRFSLCPPSEEDREKSWALLDETERQRALRFKRPLHQERFAFGRAALRRILGHYGQADPAALTFAYGPHGKPELAGNPGGIQFNLSHSGDEAVCAIVRKRRVGVDIESRREREAAKAIAARFFDAREAAHVENCHGEERLRVFYQYWAAKEALLKGAGGGLTIPLNRCCFRLDQEPLGLELRELPELARDEWTVFAFALADRYSGAIAVAGGGAQLRFIHWLRQSSAI